MGGCSPRTGIENFPELTFTKFPAPNASRVPINSKIQLFFNFPLDQDSLNPALFILMDPSGNPVPAKMDYLPLLASGGSVLTLTPLSYSQTPPVYLNINSVYTVTLGGGIKTAAGDSMTLLNVWTFATNNSPDITPPTFGGIISAEGVDMGSIKITWGPAADNPGGTPANNLIYGICYSLKSTTCPAAFVPNYVNPSAATDSNGNFNFVIKSLKPESTYYILVRVQDLAGNTDTNTVQMTASTKGGKLYVANYNNNEILAFDHPSKLNPLSNQTRSIKASQNGLIDPYGIFYDKVNDRLFVSICKTHSELNLVEAFTTTICEPGSSKIAVYNNTSLLPGKDQKPDWTLFNDNSSLNNSGLIGPVGVLLDSSAGKDRLYVANYLSGELSVYDNITSSCLAYVSANGTSGTCSVKPGIRFTSPDITYPFGIALDSGKNLLYVSNYVTAYQTVVQGTVIPIAPGTTVAVFDTTGLNKNLTRYNAIKTITGFKSPAGLWFDPANDTLYVANAGGNLGPTGSKIYPGIVAICNASLIAGGSNSFPAPKDCKDASNRPQAATQYLDGSNTGLLWPIQLVTTNSANSSTPSLYVSDYSYSKVSVFSPNPFFTTSTVDINTPPNEELHGFNKTEIAKPVGIAVSDDLSGNDNLYLVNLGWDQILFFDKVAQNYSLCTGASPPLQCAFSPQRRISPAIFGPAGVFLNNSPDLYGNPRDRLYVTSYFNNSIVVLDGASALNGNVFGNISKIISSSALQGPFGIFVDTSQNREWVYTVNSKKDSLGNYSVVVFDLSACPSNTGIYCNLDPPANGVRVITSADLIDPAGIWVDEGVDSNNQPRDLLIVSNRGLSDISSPGYITLFNNSSTLTGSVPASRMIRGDQTSLFIPTGLFMDPVKDQLYIVNQKYNDILVFNQPQNCTVSQGTNLCNVLPDRKIYNASDIPHAIDGPSSLVIDFSSDQIYLSILGLYNGNSSLLMIDHATVVNGQALISNALVKTNISLTTFPLNFPESLTLDITR